MLSKTEKLQILIILYFCKFEIVQTSIIIESKLINFKLESKLVNFHKFKLEYKLFNFKNPFFMQPATICSPPGFFNYTIYVSMST